MPADQAEGIDTTPDPRRRTETRLQRSARTGRLREWFAGKESEPLRKSTGRDWHAKDSPARRPVDRHDPSELSEVQLKHLSKEELLTIARRESLPNRSKMNKAQLARTLRKHFRNAA